jgi:hypothetical protein
MSPIASLRPATPDFRSTPMTGQLPSRSRCLDMPAGDSGLVSWCRQASESMN